MARSNLDQLSMFDLLTSPRPNATSSPGSGGWGWPVSQRDTPTASGDGGKGV